MRKRSRQLGSRISLSGLQLRLGKEEAVPQIGAAQIRVAEVSADQVGMPQICTAEVSGDEICTA